MDTLILYLRLVHSVDYYNNAEYRNEDEMPNRCGIIHVRGEPPSNPIMPFEMHDYLKKFAEKVGVFGRVYLILKYADFLGVFENLFFAV